MTFFKYKNKTIKRLCGDDVLVVPCYKFKIVPSLFYDTHNLINKT